MVHVSMHFEEHMRLLWRWILNPAVLHRGAHLCKSKVGITILATIGLHKVWFQPATPDMSNRVEAAGDVLVRMGQESYNPQITWPGGDSVPFLLIQYRLH